MFLKVLREKVIEIALRAQRDKLIPLTMGNFSIRDCESGNICITPSGMEYDKLKPEDIVVVDLQGNITDGNRKPSIETPLHCATYRRRPDVHGISHTHSVYASAWACCGEGIPIVVAELAALIEKPIECAPYRPMGSVELAEIAAEWLKDNHALLLANHGVLAVGPDLDTAYANSVIVEEGAKIAFFAKQIGTLRVIPEEECRQLRQIALKKYGQR